MSQCFWLLSNIAGDSVQARDELLQTPFVEELLAVVSLNVLPLGLLRLVCWGISNLCKGKPDPPFERVRPARDCA